MKALRLELRFVHGVRNEDLQKLPKGVQPQAPAAAAWDAVRLIATLVRQHVPAEGPVYVLTGIALEEGPDVLPEEVTVV